MLRILTRRKRRCHGACARFAGGAAGCRSNLPDLIIIIINDIDPVTIIFTTINGVIIGKLVGGRLLVRGLALGC